MLNTESVEPKDLLGVRTGSRGESGWIGEAWGVLVMTDDLSKDVDGVEWRCKDLCRTLNRSSSLSCGSCGSLLSKLRRVRRTDVDLSVEELLLQWDWLPLLC